VRFQFFPKWFFLPLPVISIFLKEAQIRTWCFSINTFCHPSFRVCSLPWKKTKDLLIKKKAWKWKWFRELSITNLPLSLLLFPIFRTSTTRKHNISIEGGNVPGFRTKHTQSLWRLEIPVFFQIFSVFFVFFLFWRCSFLVHWYVKLRLCMMETGCHYKQLNLLAPGGTSHFFAFFVLC